jgi:hypothetical protein
VPNASAICGVEIKQTRLKLSETHEESIMSYWSIWVVNLIADKGDPDGRDIQIGLADRIG